MMTAASEVISGILEIPLAITLWFSKLEFCLLVVLAFHVGTFN